MPFPCRGLVDRERNSYFYEINSVGILFFNDNCRPCSIFYLSPGHRFYAISGIRSDCLFSSRYFEETLSINACNTCNRFVAEK